MYVYIKNMVFLISFNLILLFENLEIGTAFLEISGTNICRIELR